MRKHFKYVIDLSADLRRADADSSSNIGLQHAVDPRQIAFYLSVCQPISLELLIEPADIRPPLVVADITKISQGSCKFHNHSFLARHRALYYTDRAPAFMPDNLAICKENFDKVATSVFGHYRLVRL